MLDKIKLESFFNGNKNKFILIMISVVYILFNM